MLLYEENKHGNLENITLDRGKYRAILKGQTLIFKIASSMFGKEVIVEGKRVILNRQDILPNGNLVLDFTIIDNPIPAFVLLPSLMVILGLAGFTLVKLEKITGYLTIWLLLGIIGLYLVSRK